MSSSSDFRLQPQPPSSSLYSQSARTHRKKKAGLAWPIHTLTFAHSYMYAYTCARPLLAAVWPSMTRPDMICFTLAITNSTRWPLQHAYLNSFDIHVHIHSPNGSSRVAVAPKNEREKKEEEEEEEEESPTSQPLGKTRTKAYTYIHTYIHTYICSFISRCTSVARLGLAQLGSSQRFFSTFYVTNSPLSLSGEQDAQHRTPTPSAS